MHGEERHKVMMTCNVDQIVVIDFLKNAFRERSTRARSTVRQTDGVRRQRYVGEDVVINVRTCLVVVRVY